MKKLQSKRGYILSFFIPVIVMIAVFAIRKIYPFGDTTIMTGDTSYQLVDYLSYYKTIIFGNNDFSYSMSKNMGGEMAGFAAYYLFSPLNLLTLPFPREYLFAGIGLIIILSPGLASLSMYHALIHLREEGKGEVLFSVCYGLSAYMIVYNELLYYYTNIILLPLIILSLRKLIKNGQMIRPAYILLLAAAIINNYYTGYMICLFLLIYSVYYLFCIEEGSAKIRTFLAFALNSVISVCISCFTLIPALMSLSGEKNIFSVGLYLTFPPLNYFSKLYTGSFAGDFGAGMPNIYCGIIISLLLAYLLTDKKIKLKTRVWISLLLLFFWIDFCINTLNVFWHGLNQPIGFPYRQAFVVVFFSILTVYENIDLTGNRDKKISAGIVVVFLAYSIYVLIKNIDNTGAVSVAATGLILVLLILGSYLPVKYRYYAIFAVTVADLSFNAWYTLGHFYLDTMEEYQEPLAVISDAAEKVKGLGDTDVYRMEKHFRRTNNDAMMLDYAGLTHFSSSEKKATMKFMGDLGFRNNGNWAMYTGNNTALSDSILGVRYIASQFDSSGKPYTTVYSDEDDRYTVFLNEYALPVMTAVDDDVFDVRLSEDPFGNQNMIADSMTGKDENILIRQESVREDMPDGSVRYKVDIRNDGLFYCYFSAPDLQDTKIYVNGEEWADYFRTYDWTALELHKRRNGESIQIDLVSESGSKVEVTDGFFAVTDNKKLADWSSRVKADKTELYKEDSSLYKGSYETEKETLLFSLPSDKGWSLTVDGNKCELLEACGHLMAAHVPSGHHDIILRFESPGKKAGNIISGITLLGLLLYCGIKRIKPQYFDTNLKKKS